MQYHYLNNAGAGLMSPVTLQKVSEFLKLEAELGAGPASDLWRSDLDAFYKLTSTLLNAESPDAVAFTDSASRGWNLALNGLALGKGDAIVTLSSEYGSNLISLYSLASRVGCSVRMIPCAQDGSFSMEELEDALKGAKLLAVSHAAFHASIVNPVEEMGELARKYGAAYLVDGAQAAGHIPVDVRKIGCDAYVASGRKWLGGPRGTAMLYVRPDAPIQMTHTDLASAELQFDAPGNASGVKPRAGARRFELDERNNAGMLGLNNAIRECLDVGIGKVASGASSRGTRLRKCIAANPHLSLVGPVASPSGTAAFCLMDPQEEVRVTALFHEVNLVIKVLDPQDYPCFFQGEEPQRIFRISPRHSTTREALSAVEEIIKSI